MTKWCSLFFLVSLSCLANNLSGLVQSEDGRPISGAKIVVLHEMAQVLIQRGVSDRSGQYSFKLEPGHYTLLVLKKGYAPVRTKTLLRNHKEEVSLRHEMPLDLDLSQSNAPGERYKRLIRRANRAPYRDLSHELLAPVNLQNMRDDSLTAQVQTGARQGLNGDQLSSSVIIHTQLSDTLSVNSSLSDERRDGSQHHAQAIRAGFNYLYQSLAFGFEAQTIRNQNGVAQDRSEQVKFNGTYGEEVVFHSQLALTDTRAAADRHQEFDVAQKVSYTLNQQSLSHGVRFREWQRNRNRLARQSNIHTTWKVRENAVLGLAAELDHLQVDQDEHSAAKLWVTGNRQVPNLPLVFDAQLGYHHEQTWSAWVHRYQLTAEGRFFTLRAAYTDDRNARALATHDVFGPYLENPVHLFVNHGFYRQQDRTALFQVETEHGNWNSQLTWSQQRGSADQVSRSNHLFKDQVDFTVRSLDYALVSQRLGSKIRLRYSHHDNDETAFQMTELSVGQELSPFSDRDLNVHIEIQASNHPHLPAWWLLDTLPWEHLESGAWFEGQVRLQF